MDTGRLHYRYGGALRPPRRAVMLVPPHSLCCCVASRKHFHRLNPLPAGHTKRGETTRVGRGMCLADIGEANAAT